MGSIKLILLISLGSITTSILYYIILIGKKLNELENIDSEMRYGNIGRYVVDKQMNHQKKADSHAARRQF